MGQVYLGQSRSGRRVAVKVVKQELLDRDPSFRSRFRREVDAAKAVGGFWTAAIVDSDADASPPWYASAYIDAPTLHDVVVRDGPLAPRRAMSLGAGLAEALAAIHKADLIHRDLKPPNVLMAPDGPRVIDFGIARVVTAEGVPLTATGWGLGTIGYLAPELLRGGSASAASDVFAFGALLVFATTGHLPFTGSTYAEVVLRTANEPPDLSGVDSSLMPVIERCLAKDPAERPGVPDLLDHFAAAGGDLVPEGNGTQLSVASPTLWYRNDSDTAESGHEERTVPAEQDHPPSPGTYLAHARNRMVQPWGPAWGAALAAGLIGFGQLAWFAAAPWYVAGPLAVVVMFVTLTAIRWGQLASPTIEKRWVGFACTLLSVACGGALALRLSGGSDLAWWAVTLIAIGTVVGLLGSCSLLSEVLAGWFEGPVPTSIAVGLMSGGLAAGLLAGVAGLPVWLVVPIAGVVWVMTAATVSWIAAIGYLPLEEGEYRTL